MVTTFVLGVDGRCRRNGVVGPSMKGGRLESPKSPDRSSSSPPNIGELMEGQLEESENETAETSVHSRSNTPRKVSLAEGFQEIMGGMTDPAKELWDSSNEHKSLFQVRTVFIEVSGSFGDLPFWVFKSR